MRRKRKKPTARFTRRNARLEANELNVTLQKSRISDVGAIVSALSTFGILALAIWTAYFSDFSKALVESLTIQNSELREEKVSLERETRILESRQSDLGKQIESSAKKLAELELDSLSKQKSLATLTREIKEKNMVIGNLSLEKSDLSNQTSQLKSELIENQKTLFLSRLPIDGQKYSGIPRYMIEMINDGIRMESKGDSLRKYASFAHDDMISWLSDMDQESSSFHQIAASEYIRNEFTQRCGNKVDWVNTVSNPDDTKLSYIKEEREKMEKELLNIEDKMDRLVAQSQNLKKEAEHSKVEIEFYFSHMSDNVGRCFSF